MKAYQCPFTKDEMSCPYVDTLDMSKTEDCKTCMFNDEYKNMIDDLNVFMHGL